MVKLAILAAVAVLALSTAGAAGAQEPGQDSVTGGGSFGCSTGCELFEVDAFSGPSGENPTGSLGGGGGTPTLIRSYGGEVTCLSVKGNHAVIGVSGWLSLVFNSRPELDREGPASFLVYVVDDRQPDTDPDTPMFDSVFVDAEHSAFDHPPITECPTPDNAPPGEPFANGDLAVHDAPSIPMSKQACREGGWRELGYETRQDCINAAEYQARQECIFIRAAHGVPAFRAWYGTPVHKRNPMRRCIRDRATT